MKIECGYKGNIRLIQNASEAFDYDYVSSQFLSDSNRTNSFDFLEQVHAMYVTFTQKIGKFNYKLGLRVEHGELLILPLALMDETFENQYFSFFPTMNMSHDMGNNQQMQLSFSRRIRRPSIWLLNPFPSYSDPLNLRYGNPFLLPQYSNNVELSYTRYWNKGHTIVFSGFYRFNTDLMENLRTVDESTNVSTTTYYTLNVSHVYGGS